MYTCSRKYWLHLKTVCIRTVTRTQFLTQDPQTLGAIVRTLATTTTWRPTFVHPLYTHFLCISLHIKIHHRTQRLRQLLVIMGPTTRMQLDQPLQRRWTVKGNCSWEMWYVGPQRKHHTRARGTNRKRGWLGTCRRGRGGGDYFLTTQIRTYSKAHTSADTQWHYLVWIAGRREHQFRQHVLPYRRMTYLHVTHQCVCVSNCSHNNQLSLPSTT